MSAGVALPGTWVRLFFICLHGYANMSLCICYLLKPGKPDRSEGDPGRGLNRSPLTRCYLSLSLLVAGSCGGANATKARLLTIQTQHPHRNSLSITPSHQSQHQHLNNLLALPSHCCQHDHTPLPLPHIYLIILNVVPSIVMICLLPCRVVGPACILMFSNRCTSRFIAPTCVLRKPLFHLYICTPLHSASR